MHNRYQENSNKKGIKRKPRTQAHMANTLSNAVLEQEKYNQTLVMVKEGSGELVSQDYQDETEIITSVAAYGRRYNQTPIIVKKGSGELASESYQGETEIISKGRARRKKSNQSFITVKKGTIELAPENYQGEIEVISLSVASKKKYDKLVVVIKGKGELAPEGYPGETETILASKAATRRSAQQFVTVEKGTGVLATKHYLGETEFIRLSAAYARRRGSNRKNKKRKANTLSSIEMPDKPKTRARLSPANQTANESNENRVLAPVNPEFNISTHTAILNNTEILDFAQPSQRSRENNAVVQENPVFLLENAVDVADTPNLANLYRSEEAKWDNFLDGITTNLVYAPPEQSQNILLQQAYAAISLPNPVQLRQAQNQPSPAFAPTVNPVRSQYPQINHPMHYTTTHTSNMSYPDARFYRHDFPNNQPFATMPVFHEPLRPLSNQAMPSMHSQQPTMRAATAFQNSPAHIPYQTAANESNIYRQPTQRQTFFNAHSNSRMPDNSFSPHNQSLRKGF